MKRTYKYSKITKLAGGVWRYAMALAAGVIFTGTAALGQGTSFSQWANEGNQWIPGILNPNNSQYYEGTSTLQRLVLVGIPTDGQQELKFKVLAKKGNVYAYDFVTGFDQGIQDYANVTGSTAGIMMGLTKEQLVAYQSIPNPATAQMITDLYTGGNTAFATALSSDYNGTTGDLAVKDVIDAYDLPGYPGTAPKRAIELYGSEIINSASLTFDGFVKKGSDTYGFYTLRWDSNSDNILILMAGHLSIGDPANTGYNGLAYGAGKGASSISGGPYHFKLETLNGSSLGNQDNQIQSGAIEVFVIQNCSIVPTSSVCDGDTTTHTASTDVADATYDWTITGNGKINNNLDQLVTTYQTVATGGAMQSSVDVVADGAGSYTLSVSISKQGFITKQCSITVTVNDVPAEPVVQLYAASLCDTITAPKLEVLCPEVGVTYTLKQWNVAGTRAITYDGTNDPVVFYNMQAGNKFNIVASKGGCSSDSVTCDNYTNYTCPSSSSSKEVAPQSKPVIGDIESASLTAYPVPFSDKVTIEFTSGHDEEYVINLYDMKGNMVKQLKAGHAKAGELIMVEVDGRGMAESIYIARKVSNNGVSTVKLLKRDE